MKPRTTAFAVSISQSSKSSAEVGEELTHSIYGATDSLQMTEIPRRSSGGPRGWRSDSSAPAYVWVGVENRHRDITTREVDDLDAEERAGRLTELLATGIERLLRSEARVDDAGDVSVYPGVEPDRSPW